MVVLILQKVPATLRGELSRWMIEPRTGVFVGKISAIVRDRLWERVCKGATASGSGMLLYSSPTEQGYTIRSFGEPTRTIVELEGLFLVHVPQSTREKSKIVNK